MTYRSIAQSGFTLTEMLVVIAIVAVTSAISLPYFDSRHGGGNADMAGQALVTLLRTAQVTALSKGKNVGVIFDAQKRLFETSAGLPHVQVPKDVSISLLGIDDEKEPNDLRYVFFALGGNTGGTIHLSSATDSAVVKLNWLTGTVDLEEEAVRQ